MAHDDYDAQDDFAKSLLVAYATIRERVAAGGPPWVPKDWEHEGSDGRRVGDAVVHVKSS